MVTSLFNCALRHNTPSASDISYESGERVLVFGERVIKNRIGERLGPFTIKGVCMERNLDYAQLKDKDSPKAFYLAQVRKYFVMNQADGSFFNDLGTAP